MAHHFECHRVDLRLRLLVELELGRDAQVLRRHVAGAPAVEDDTGELAQFFQWCIHLKVISKLPSASRRSVRPGCTTTVVSAVSTMAGPLMRLPMTSFSPSKTGVWRSL